MMNMIKLYLLFLMWAYNGHISFDNSNKYIEYERAINIIIFILLLLLFLVFLLLSLVFLLLDVHFCYSYHRKISIFVLFDNSTTTTTTTTTTNNNNNNTNSNTCSLHHCYF